MATPAETRGIACLRAALGAVHKLYSTGDLGRFRGRASGVRSLGYLVWRSGDDPKRMGATGEIATRSAACPLC
jgi:hypothetical protein